MIGATDPMTQSPEAIQADILRRRAALDLKIHEIERRLSPREQMARVRSHLRPEPYLGVLAAAAVATGAALAYRGLRRTWHSNGTPVMDDPATAEMMGE
jgi:hypothetical protein